MINSDLLPKVEYVSKQLKSKNLRVAVAESCSGGLLATYLTELPGSSDWFECGWVTYSNLAKEKILGIPQGILNTHGAVSSETVSAMVASVLNLSKEADIAIAISGIAGPTGGSIDKPVGTVWIGYGRRGEPPYSRSFLFSGNRHEIREKSVIQSLDLVLELCLPHS